MLAVRAEETIHDSLGQNFPSTCLNLDLLPIVFGTTRPHLELFCIRYRVEVSQLCPLTVGCVKNVFSERPDRANVSQFVSKQPPRSYQLVADPQDDLVHGVLSTDTMSASVSENARSSQE